ncbi:helix-turn-helix transcriptional regulator [Phycisphaerales bacterium AB-hyl4]|uniref:Helix-turn-helix transcriptional regulator n=1 Tax=Natronomicrosphaera hydrolytica TaxID=3242702 RepID=A0ABV4U4I8_9BACT
MVRDWVRPGGVRSVGLTPAQTTRLETLMTALRDDFHRPTRLSAMRNEHALLELSMLAMKQVAGRTTASQADHARRKVSQAMAWYAEHLPERPGVADVAAAVHVSPSHLRRLFAQVGRGSPLAAMHRVQVDRACELMSNAGLSLTGIAPRCGYASLSSFSRAFSAQRGVSPTAWRSRVRR